MDTGECVVRRFGKMHTPVTRPPFGGLQRHRILPNPNFSQMAATTEARGLRRLPRRGYRRPQSATFWKFQFSRSARQDETDALRSIERILPITASRR